MLLALKRTDNGVSILQTVKENLSNEELQLEVDKFSDSYKEGNILAWRVITPNDIPSDRDFRDAWTDDNPTQTVDVDLTKARALIRQKRDKQLLVLDEKAFAESRKPKGDLTAINAEAQRLRDIPQHADFASDDVSVLRNVLASTELQV